VSDVDARSFCALGVRRERKMARRSSTARLPTEPARPRECELGDRTPGAADSPKPEPLAKLEPPPLRSVHTSNFSAILQELGSSVLVTTYQAGKLVILRPDGERLNSHFRGFREPMGLAVDGDRLALGTSVEIWG
jgi:hypothetical protein